MIAWCDWGTVPFREAWARQEELRTLRAGGALQDQLILCEHPRVFTLGRRDCASDWKADPATIARAGIAVVPTNRGGKITYHGPGQLVGYWIVHLGERGIGVRDFVRTLEAVLIHSCAALGITAQRDPEHPGVWVGPHKIAALGLHVSHGVTAHGFAFNYAVDLADYAYITPCGIADRGVTSLAQQGIAIDRPRLCTQLLASVRALVDAEVEQQHEAYP